MSVFTTAGSSRNDSIGFHVARCHLISDAPGDEAPVDFGMVKVRNPDFTPFKDSDGRPMQFHRGFVELQNAKTVTKHVIFGVCEAHDGSVRMLALQPYTVLKVDAADLK